MKTRVNLKDNTLSRYTTGLLEEYVNIQKTLFLSFGPKRGDLPALTEHLVKIHLLSVPFLHTAEEPQQQCDILGPLDRYSCVFIPPVPRARICHTHLPKNMARWCQPVVWLLPPQLSWHVWMLRACQIIGKMIRLVAHTCLAPFEWGSLGPL